MSLLASLALTTCATFLPQDPAAAAAPAKPPLLSAAEQASVRDKLVKYLDASEDYARAESLKDREKSARNKEKAKEALTKEWEKAAKKGNLLGSMADLRAIYDNCFTIPNPKVTAGTAKKEVVKDSKLEYTVFVPKAYKADKPTRTLLVLPGTTAADQSGSWIDSSRWLEATWEKAALQADTVIHVAQLPDKMEMDTVPDFSREGQDAQERSRIESVFSGLGATMSGYNIDRSRLFLDCARGNCGFGLRFVSMFPDRFAGVVLRHPVAVDELRLGSLLGIPTLLIKTAANAAVVDALKGRLEAVTPNSVTVVDATDEYPHKAANPAIEAWMAKQRRNMTPSRVVIEPNHDQYNRSYWVRPGTMNPLHLSTGDSKPRIEVQADRANNRIVVNARGIDNFLLLLNDDLVDLDKEFTVVVNDKAVTEKRTRDRRRLEELLLQRRDWDCLYPVVYESAVAKPAPAAGDGK